MKGSRLLVWLRELGNLGLPAETFMLAALRGLREVIPGVSGAFFWVDGAGRISDCCADRLPAPSHARLDPNEACLEDRFVRSVLQVNGAKRASVCDVVAGTRIAGHLHAYRRDCTEALSARQLELLVPAVRYLGAGLANAGRQPADPGPVPVSEELVVCSPQGRIVHATEGSWTLLLLASGAPITPGGMPRAATMSQDLLASLCGQLAQAPHESILELRRESPWGFFTFRMHRMPASASDAAPLVAVQLHRHQPSRLHVLEALRQRRLSSRQREIALLISLGRTNAEIASILNVSANTVSYHVKWLFSRFEVHSRSGLLGQLMTSLAQAR
jgi:DNA-binding CsgD family transcriptional regulator